MSGGPRWLHQAESVYAAALHLYPRAFREQWAQPMRQAFRDRCREAATGSLPLAALALELCTDLAASAAAQHLHQWKEPAMKTVAATVSALLLATLFAVHLPRGGLGAATLLALAPAALALLAFARPAWKPVRAAACIVNALVLVMVAASLPGGELRLLLALDQPAMLSLFLAAGLLSPALNLAALLRWPRLSRDGHPTAA